MSYFFRNFVPDLGVLCFKEINRETKKTMDMKKTLLVLCALVASVSGFALEVIVDTSEGVSLKYETIGATTVRLTGIVDSLTSGSVTIPDKVWTGSRECTVTSIGNYAFLSCPNITKVVIPEGVTTIGYQAFYKCVSLSEITIPSTVSSIGNSAFSGCKKLGRANISDMTAWCHIKFADATSNPLAQIGRDQSGLDAALYLNGNKVTELEISAGTDSISSWAFVYNSSIESVTIKTGASVQSIGYQAFWGCSNLKEFVLEGELKAMGANLWSHTSLSRVKVPNVAAWCAIEFDGAGANPLYYMNDKVLYDENGDVIEDLVIPAGVTFISPWAFVYNTALKSVTIPSTLETIGNQAFYGCVNIDTIDCRKDATPATFPSGSPFGGGVYTSALLRTAPNDFGAYLTSNIWKSFTNFETEIVEDGKDTSPFGGIVAVDIPSSKTVTVSYTRNFGNTKWQAWFVPFDVAYSELADDFEVAQFSKTEAAFDENGKLFMEYQRLDASDRLSANTPYLVRAKATGLHTVKTNISTLKSCTDGLEHTSGICTFTGTYVPYCYYTGDPSDDTYDHLTWVVSGGQLCRGASSAARLNPYRWYMSIAKDDIPEEYMLSLQSASVNEMSMIVVYDATDKETAVESIETNAVADDACYNLAGQRVERPTKGIYVKNGKKVLF